LDINYQFPSIPSYSLLVDVGYFHVHRVDGGEDVGGTLHHTLPGFGHGNRSAGGQKDGLVATAEGQE